ncbi:MAG: glycosyltransferase [Sphingobacteriaceae bacterium]|nr:glycosyltransferase [Sphingobacteriaceae bacterium]
MTVPMISVLMPVYNAEKYVAEAIESILQQTYCDFEFIIVDDCSTDGSYHILQSYAKIEPRIRLFRNEQNEKLPKTLNFGISQAIGKYILRMDADDVSLPERFAKQVSFMESHPEVDICGGFAYVFGGATSEKLMRVQLSPLLIKAYTYFVDCNLIHPTVSLRRSVFDRFGLRYNESKHCLAEDYELWLQALFRGVVLNNLPTPLIKYRRSNTQLTKVNEIEMLQYTQAQVMIHLKMLFGESYSTKLFQQHEFYILGANPVKLMINYIGFYCYKRKFIYYNRISKVLSSQEILMFFQTLDPFYKILNRLKSLFT